MITTAFLLDACRDVLIADNSWASQEVDITPDGKPTPIRSDFFVGLFAPDSDNQKPNVPQDCHLMGTAFVARVSVLNRMTPVARYERKYYESLKSLQRTGTLVVKALMDKRETIRATVNSALSSATEEYNAWMGMTRTFTLLSYANQATSRDASWWSSKDTEREKHDPYNVHGYSLDINFGNVQYTFASNE